MDADRNWTRGLDFVREDVRRALLHHVQGVDSTGYDRVKNVFSSRREENEEEVDGESVRRHLIALAGNVSLLGKKCSGLVHQVLGCQWVGRDEGFVSVFVRFMGNLCSAQAGYLGACLRMLVEMLEGVSRSSGRLSGYSPVPLEAMNQRVHMALRYLLQLNPAASGAMPPILASSFPSHDDSSKAYVTYTKNLLQVVEYAPELKSDILALITERLVKIDVQVQVDMDDLEEEMEERLVKGEAEKDEDGSDSDSESDSDDDMSDSDDEVDPETQRIKDVKSNIEKMDSMLDILFGYYEPSFSTTSMDEKENTLDILLSHFHNIILPTYRSRHSQFLLFHFSQSNPTLIDRFASTCIQILFDKRQPAITRRSAAAYLASFVARGSHVPGGVVRDVFDLLCSHLDELRVEAEPTCLGPDLRRYSAFYSTAQALLYIFCFRWRDLLDPEEVDEDEDVDPNEHELIWSPGVKDTLMRAIYSKLNPLKVCSPAIVAEFARIANFLRFLYVYPLLETNKRLRMSQFRVLGGGSDARMERETALSARMDESSYQLDAYFPFDPYHLPKSRKWVDADYVEWKGIEGLDDDKGDDSEDEEEDRDGDDVSEEEIEGTETDVSP